MLKLREYGLLRLGHPKYLLDVDAVLSTEADIREELTTEMERLLFGRALQIRLPQMVA